ncbi:MAG: hypothetical protein A3A04_00310 [Candidatus Harrisonbacteria bacterium RIFCSPLOWO2_01_FULL_40_28]|uniref:AAA+ ATPase domain-containing protein n=1 Tax=Candidatus Harrisonbacteria bacterium RIFCSPLOWO2_01_FULL_40_28 TaxID=1798406 RepID=A0A1G1ZL88_9BACT|nr:MAG: hypothetical protein A3A04_00310 [Candidatus Harrisonbacteria bacterium RIFCSPLOWO2_01_FULL_40_28]
MAIDDLELIKDTASCIKKSLKEVVLGIDKTIDLLVIALFSRGHCLLEGPPGQAKTTLCLALSRVIKGKFIRFQGMPDALPSDILYEIYIGENGSLLFQKGPLLHYAENVGVVLIDEINRFQGKTQAVFLQAMQERIVSLGRETICLPHALFVATRNPLEKHETYELPPAQRDRFFMEIEVGYPDTEQEERILKESLFHTMERLLSPIKSLISLEELSLAAERIQEEIKISDTLIRYAYAIIRATRNPSEFDISTTTKEDERSWLKAGISSRGGIKLIEAAKTAACLRGSPVVVPYDIHSIMHEVLAHRIFVESFAESERSVLVREFLQKIRQQITTPSGD